MVSNTINLIMVFIIICFNTQWTLCHPAVSILGTIIYTAATIILYKKKSINLLKTW